jgi:predicted porin
VWETRFGTAGLTSEPFRGVSVVFQYLLGRTATRANRFESTFNAWYTLLSYRYRGHRLSARYDDFAVHDKDGPPSTRERGYAVTIAYLFELWLRHRLAVEYITIHSERPDASAPDPNDGGWQVSYRFRY